MFLKNITEIIIKFFFQFTFFEKKQINKKKYRVLVLAHLTNFESFSKNIDFQYGNFFQNKFDDILFFYINSSKNKKDKYKTIKSNKKLKKDYLIFDHKLNFFDICKFIYFLCNEFIILFFSILKK